MTSSATTETTAVQVAGLHRTYGSDATAVHALRGVDLVVASGEVVALTGPSGSGKTTLLNCILGLDSSHTGNKEHADSGSIEVLGYNVGEMGYEQAVDWRREHVAIVFQTPGLISHLSGRENVDAVLRLKATASRANRLSAAERSARIDEVLADLEIADLGDHLPEELSGGQRQRFAIARAVAARPTLLVADEPTGELDSATSEHVFTYLLNEARRHHVTMLVATHDPAVGEMADRVERLNDGRIATEQK